MAYAFSLLRSSATRTGGRTIASVAAQVITFNVALPTSAAVGRLVEVYNSATNNGFYTITVVAGLQVTVAEPINNSGASGSGACNPFGVERITSGPAITSFPDTETITVNTANFITNGTLRGDRLAIYGSTSNDGSYLIKYVETETTVKVYSRAGAANPLTVEAAAGNIRLTAGYGGLTLTDQATSSWTAVQAAFPALVDIFTLPTGMTLVRPATIRRIDIVQTGATATNWTSEEEIVVPYRSSTDDVRIFWYSNSAVGLFSTVRLGVAGSDDYSFRDGSYWFIGSYGATQSTRLTTQAYGSVFQGCGTIGGIQNFNPGKDSILHGCLLDESYPLFPGDVSQTGGDIKNTTITNPTKSPITILTNDADIGDLFLADSSNFGISTLGGGTAIVQDLRIAADVYRPVWFLVAATVIVRDPKEDYTLAELFTNISATALGQVDYTWDPRFVSRDTVGNQGDPIQGLTVRVYMIWRGIAEIGEIAGSPFTTQADGRLPAAENLIARYHVNLGAPFGVVAINEVDYRVTVEGPGFRAINMIITVREPNSADIPVDFLLTDFEGEVST